jgi:hypothetical protein
MRDSNGVPTVIALLERRTMMSIAFTPVFGPESIISDGSARIVSPPIFMILWGTYWQQNRVQASEIENAASEVAASPFLTSIAEYVRGGATMGDGSQTMILSSVSDPATFGFSQASLQEGTDEVGNVVEQAMTDGELPSPAQLRRDPIYVVITPPGVLTGQANVAGENFTRTFAGSNLNCIWASVGTIGAPSNALNLDEFTRVFCHEVAERMSDPYGAGIRVDPGQGWSLALQR